MHSFHKRTWQPGSKARWLLAVSSVLSISTPIALAWSIDAGESGLEASNEEPSRPNVVCVLADDQGYGDFGFLGNEDIHTPNLDRMAAASTWMSRFYVTPVCTSTRASLMTGRYSRRTGILRNGSEMFPEEVTLAESFRQAGYATGIFGKWHLGRHYPVRAMDQGFDEVLSFRGGVLREYEEQPLSVRYTNPVLEHNGSLARHEGFATDIFFGAALVWIEEQAKANKSFFAYIAPAAPHGPYDDIPADTRALYSDEQLKRLGELNLSIYSLVSKLDQNMGKLLDRLERLDLSKNTLVLYLSDNGPSHVNKQRFMAGCRGHKGEILEGGIKTPMLAYWPGTLGAVRIDDNFGSVIDLAPTLHDICGLKAGALAFDGRSLWKLWQGQEPKTPNRNLVVQINKLGSIDSNYAVISRRWKLARPAGFFGSEVEEDQVYLYDLLRDPLETKQLLGTKRRIMIRLDQVFWDWKKDIFKDEQDERFSRRNRTWKGQRYRYTMRVPNPIWIGNDIEEPVLLTKRNGPEDPLSEWLLETKQDGAFAFEIRFAPRTKAGRADLLLERFENSAMDEPLEQVKLSQELAQGAASCSFERVALGKGIWRLAPELHTAQELKTAHLGVWQVLIKHLDQN